jgi:hypothetical protein
MTREITGVCRFCGCSQFDACVDSFFGSCAWLVFTGRRVCTACAPAAKAEALALKVRRNRRSLSAAWRAAFHRGFIVGWFAVTARSPYGRNPYDSPDGRAAWAMGQRAGDVARHSYTTTFGPIGNRPRRHVFTQGGKNGTHRLDGVVWRRVARRRRHSSVVRRSAPAHRRA